MTSSELEEFASEHSVEKLKSLYREGIRYNDKQFKEYLDHIKSQEKYEESLIILAGDHGEALGEHGDFGHAGLVHEEQIRIPLIVKFPEQRYAGRNVDTPVSLVDIFNTVLDCIGAKQNKSQDGRSLITTIEGDVNNRPIHAETYPNPGVAHSQSVRWNDYKWMSVNYPRVFSDLNPKKIFHRLRKLRQDILWRNDRFYDLDDDSSESDWQSVAHEPKLMRDDREGLLHYIQKRKNETENQQWSPQSSDDREVEDRLRELGYLE